MADSAFWRDLAEKFLASPNFRADGHYVIGSGQPWTWQLAGVAAPYIRNAFEALARRAASEIADAGSHDLLIVWMEELRKGSYNFTISNQAHEVQPDGTEGPHYLMGSIYGVCQASATLCKKLEADAIQTEFETAQRNNPRNWTQFRQQFEALKSMRKIHDAPAERIPENFARNAIARIYGIKPEDVTTEQIAFEVAGLLPAYPRIELIPSAPIEAPTPAPETEHSYVGIDKNRSSPQPSSESVTPPIAPTETIASQIQRLRIECGLTEEQLAEEINLDIRTVQRHLASDSIPRALVLRKYEKVFSKLLNKNIVIRQMP
jgi:hypothetical protein